MAPREGHQIGPEEGQVIVQVRKNNKVQHLQGFTPLDMGGTDLPEFGRLEAVTFGEHYVLMLALANLGRFTAVALWNWVVRQGELSLELGDRVVQKGLVKGHGWGLNGALLSSGSSGSGEGHGIFKEKLIEKALRPIVAKVAAEEARGRVAVGTVLIVLLLGADDPLNFGGTGGGFGVGNHVPVETQVVLKGGKNLGGNGFGVCLGKQQIFREILVGVVELHFEVLGQLAVAIAQVFERVDIFGFVGFVLKQGLKVEHNQVFDLAKGEEIDAEQGQVKLGIGVNNAVENLGTFTRIDIGVANFPQFWAFIAPALNGGGGAASAADVVLKPFWNRSRLELKSRR